MAKKEEPKETKEENKHLPIVANGRGLALRSMDDMWRFACAVRDSGLAPRSFGKPEQILIAIQSGAELGMPPMRSLQSFCVVHGNARLWGDAPLALVRQSGHLEYVKETIEGDIGKDLSKTPDEVRAVCITKRKGDPEPKQREFSVGDARRAGLWNKKTEKGYNSVWMNYPQRMLQMRARALNLRDNFPDCFSGATIAEEFEGIEMPTEQPTPFVPPRDERKKVDSKVTDTKQTIENELNDFIEKLVKKIEDETAVILHPVDDVMVIKEALNAYVQDAFSDTKTDYKDLSNYDIATIMQLNEELKNPLPDVVIELLPEKPMTKEEVEEHLDEKLKEWKYKCNACGKLFDEPTGMGKKPLCPKCLSNQITDMEKEQEK